MAKKALRQAAMTGTIDVACVIHGTKYDWCYVERLFNMVTRHSTRPIRFHVFTESDRSVPDYMVKHVLHDWPGIAGPKKSWWYKMQMFEPGRVIAGNAGVLLTRIAFRDAALVTRSPAMQGD
jgi:hypothetical protein